MKYYLKYYIILQLIALMTFIVALAYQQYTIALCGYAGVMIVSIWYMVLTKDIRKEVDENG